MAALRRVCQHVQPHCRSGPMAPSIQDLELEFQPGAQRVLDTCAGLGVEMRVNETVQSPLAQARLWRQSRAMEEIRARIAARRAAGAPFLAECIEKVGPQHGDHVTNAPPGLSWHRWGEAWIASGSSTDARSGRRLARSTVRM